MTRTNLPGGFTLLEVLVALAILEVGLVGTVGVLVIAQRDLSTAERLHIATQAAAGVADSLLAGNVADSGGEDAPWGRLRWSADEAGIELAAEELSGSRLIEWWIPFPQAEP